MKKKTKGGFDNILKIFVIILMMINVACGDRPRVVLDEKKMVALMVDMEIAEAYAQENGLTTKEKNEIGKRVLASHNVSEERLDTTLVWYGKNLDEYTKLFEKIDKELEKRKFRYSENPFENIANATNLWPYQRDVMITKKGDNDGLVFSFRDPMIEKGEIIKLTFALPARNSGKGILGVEYIDGSGEALSSNFNHKSHVEIELQSDTSKTVARLYGSLLFKERETFPVYIDSISLNLQPMDSTSYRLKKRNQKAYGMKREKPKPLKKEAFGQDSISSSGLDHR